VEGSWYSGSVIHGLGMRLASSLSFSLSFSSLVLVIITVRLSDQALSIRDKPGNRKTLGGGKWSGCWKKTKGPMEIGPTCFAGTRANNTNGRHEFDGVGRGRKEGRRMRDTYRVANKIPYIYILP